MTLARASTAIATKLSRLPLLSPSPLPHISISRSSSPPASLFLRDFSRNRPIASYSSSSSSSPSASSMAATLPSSIYDITIKDIKGNDVSLNAYKGKVLLIVNVASQCGLTTSNYTELTDIYSKYKDQGLEILAFPCNQFAGQEPGSNEEIQQFACTRFKAEYPIFDKVDVNGGKTAPIYKFLKKAKGGGIFGDMVKWNFTKFLVSRDGEVVQRFAPTTAPSKIEDDIKKVLGSS